MVSSIRNYVRSFPNPLLALAFKDGVDYVGDPDFRALDPKKEGDMWEVIVEHEVDEDDDDEDDAVVMGPARAIPVKTYSKTAVVPEKKQLSLKDYEAKFDKMKPRPITATSKDEVIHPPVKIENDGSVKLFMPTEPNTKEPEPLPPIPLSEIEPCGACLSCAHGATESCMNIINAACLASM